MKIYIDENESPSFAEHINRIFDAGLTLRTPQDENLLGMKDIPLFEELQRRDFGAIITRDRMQLRRVDPETGVSEADKLNECGLHWIGHTEPRSSGVDLIAELTALYLANWPALTELLPTLLAPAAIQIRRASGKPLKPFPLAK